MPQRIKMAITIHTTMIVTALFDELFFLFSGAEVEFDTFPVEEVVEYISQNYHILFF